jgi:hypothetical protein
LLGGINVARSRETQTGERSYGDEEHDQGEQDRQAEGQGIAARRGSQGSEDGEGANELPSAGRGDGKERLEEISWWKNSACNTQRGHRQGNQNQSREIEIQEGLGGLYALAV